MQIVNVVFIILAKNKSYEKVFITAAVLLTGLVFFPNKKERFSSFKIKHLRQRNQKSFYKNVDSASASKYKILNSKPKEQNKYHILKKEEKPAYKFTLHHKHDYCLSLKKENK